VQPIHRLSGRSVRFVEDCQGPEAARAITVMLPGNIGVLENTRFHSGEEKNDPELAKGMAALGDSYNEASRVCGAGLIKTQLSIMAPLMRGTFGGNTACVEVQAGPHG